MKNLVIFAMIMLLLGSGYMYGTKMATDMGITKIPSLEDNGYNNLKSHESRKGTSNIFEDQSNSINDLFNKFKELRDLIYNYVYKWFDKTAPALTNDTDNSVKVISKEEAKKIAQKYIEEPGAVAGEPVLVTMDKKLTYIVPVLLNGEKVGEIYIDARTGKNLGGAGGIKDNETENLENNQSMVDISSKEQHNESNKENQVINNECVNENSNKEPDNDSNYDICNNN